MDIGDIQYLEVPAKVRIANFIRIGAGLSDPMKGRSYMDGEGSTCAIGAALVGKYGSYDDAWNAKMNTGKMPQAAYAELLGISEEEVSRISVHYESTTKTREQIADWLESEGY